ncbi:MAG TPA: MauE/DoxX family redox-associated membrane protein [Flavipsychrobacter sp.]|nr:MauE/DoxX family redox-associated membrane protein [Flavipsychrobacter sp.]
MNNELPKKKASFYIKRILGLILLLVMAAVFLFSGYSKLYSTNAFDNFQWTFLDLGINSIAAAGIIARLFIGFEFLLGLFCLFHIFLRGFTYPTIIALLSVFIVYLIVVLVRQGNVGSCGCFGDKVAMTPLAAIWKNVAMIVVTIVLIYIYPIKPYKGQEWLVAILGMAALVVPFVVNPLNTNSAPEGLYKAINLDPLYQASPAPSVELRKGKHIISFMSLTCPHCKKAAYLLQIIYKQHPDFPIFLVLTGPEQEQNNFFKETHAEQIPHIYFKSTDAFLGMAGPAVPAIYWVNNGYIERKSTYAYYQLDPKYMKEWLNSPSTH